MVKLRTYVYDKINDLVLLASKLCTFIGDTYAMPLQLSQYALIIDANILMFTFLHM